MMSPFRHCLSLLLQFRLHLRHPYPGLLMTLFHVQVLCASGSRIVGMAVDVHQHNVDELFYNSVLSDLDTLECAANGLHQKADTLFGGLVWSA